MSRYLPLNLRWRFTTWNGFIQWRSLLYRIYINIFGIFLKIPILPMGFSWQFKEIDIWYRGDDLICFFRKGKVKYQSITSSGEFNSLKEIDEFWKSYYKACEESDKNIDYGSSAHDLFDPYN